MTSINFTPEQMACLTCVDLPTLMSHHPADPSASAPAAVPTSEGQPAEGATPGSAATPHNGSTAQTDGDQLPKPTPATETESADGNTASADDVTPAAGGDVTPAAEVGAETTETADQTGQDGQQGSRKRRRSDDETEADRRRSKVRAVRLCARVFYL